MLKQQIINKYSHMHGRTTQYLALAWKIPYAERINIATMAMNTVITPVLEDRKHGFRNIDEVLRAVKAEAAKMAQQWLNHSLADQLGAF